MKYIKLFIILFFFNNCYSQSTWVSLGNQTISSGRLYVKYGKTRCVGLTGQAYTATIKNISQTRLHIVGKVYANLICGNRVNVDFDYTIEPGETKGGGNAVTSFSVGNVWKEDCSQFIDRGKDADGSICYDRIRSVDIEFTSIEDLTEQEKIEQEKIEKEEKEKIEKEEQIKKEDEIKKQAEENEIKEAENEKAEEEARKKAEELENQRKENLKQYNDDKHKQFKEDKTKEDVKMASSIAGITTGAIGIGTLISNLTSKNSEKNFYRGPSWHIGLNVGLDFDLNNILTQHEITEYSYNGNNYYDEAHITDTATFYNFGTGIGIGVNINPIFSEHIGFGGYVNATIGANPLLIIGGSVSNSTNLLYSTLESKTLNTSIYYKFGYGGDLWLGVKPVKLLGIYEETVHGLKINKSVSSDNFYDNYTRTKSESSSQNVLYRYSLYGGGLRLLPFNRKKTTLDILYLRAQYLFFDWHKSSTFIERNQLIHAENKIRISIWIQSRFNSEFTYGWKQTNAINRENLSVKSKSPFNFNLKIAYTISWFGKPMWKEK